MPVSSPSETPTHSGGVVYTVLNGRRYYLLVSSSSSPGEWVLPKGSIKKDETPAEAALREVREEAGVRAEIVTDLDRTALEGSGQSKRVRYFLMRYLWEVERVEQRARDFWPYPEVLERTSRESVQNALQDAEQAAKRSAGPLQPSLGPKAPDGPVPLPPVRALPVPPKPVAPAQSHFHELLKTQLQSLSEQLEQAQAAAQRFLFRFTFGGLIAIFAVQGADLLLRRALSWPYGLVVLLLSAAYFALVAHQLVRFADDRRKLTYQRDLTLHATLSDSQPERYAQLFEASPDEPPPEDFEARFPEGAGFEQIGRFLLDRHRAQRHGPNRWSSRSSAFTGPLLGILLVLLSLLARALFTL